MRLGRRENEANPYHNKNGATGRRKILTLDDRVDVLKRIDNSIAAAVYCGKSQISRIRSDRAAILKEWESGARYDVFQVLTLNVLIN